MGFFVVLGIIGALFGEDTTDTATQATETPATEPATTANEPEATEATAKPTTTARQTDLRKPVRDGKFEFVVSSFSCSGTTCRASVAVENIGDESQTMFAANQYLYDDQGRQFEADSVASSDSLFLQDLNPGTTAKGTVVWKVPANLKADHLELHDSAFSGGVEVKL
jgi:hypothetical protein